MANAERELPAGSTTKRVEYHDRFAQDIPASLSKEETQNRLHAGIKRGLNELWEEHGRLDDIEIDTVVHRSHIKPEYSFLEVSIKAISVRYSL